MDLIIRNARLRGVDEIRDIGVDSGRIVRIERHLSDNASTEIDAHVNVFVITFRYVEDDIGVVRRVLARIFVPWDASNHVRATSHRLVSSNSASLPGSRMRPS